jgi:hypothetical protein
MIKVIANTFFVSDCLLLAAANQIKARLRFPSPLGEAHSCKQAEILLPAMHSHACLSVSQSPWQATSKALDGTGLGCLF